MKPPYPLVCIPTAKGPLCSKFELNSLKYNCELLFNAVLDQVREVVITTIAESIEASL